MNYTLIILGIILILVLYVLYRFLYDKQTTISSQQYLNDSVADVKFSDLSNPSSSRYSYSIWIYVNSLGGDTNIFEINDGTDKYRFYLKAYTDGSLKYLLRDNGDVEKIITPNFPLQKWVCVIISVDGNVIDLYLDGKLVKSQKSNGDTKKPTEGSIITYTASDIYIAEHKRVPNPTDPQTAWDTYMAGNGGSYISNSFASYGANLILTKDQVDQKKFILF